MLLAERFETGVALEVEHTQILDVLANFKVRAAALYTLNLVLPTLFDFCFDTQAHQYLGGSQKVSIGDDYIMASPFEVSRLLHILSRSRASMNIHSNISNGLSNDDRDTFEKRSISQGS